MLDAMACIAPPEPNDAMTRIAPRLVPQPNGKQQNLAGSQLESFGVDLRFETARSSTMIPLFVLPFTLLVVLASSTSGDQHFC